MSDFTLFLIVFLTLLLLVSRLFRRRRKRPSPRRHAPRQQLPTQEDQRPLALLDGSNVMHWRDGTPEIGTIRHVLALVTARGHQAGIIFDASAGYRLRGSFMNDTDFASALDISQDRIFVVPKGRQADTFLLEHASENGAKIISQDRFRDHLANFPALALPGRLVRGGFYEGQFWLNLDPVQPPPAPSPSRP